MRNDERFAILGAFAVASLAVASGLRAFPSTADWRADPSQSPQCGAGDLWSNGSVRAFGISCQHCHVDDGQQQGMITAEITYEPPLGDGKYLPATTYTVTVKLIGEHLGLTDQAHNRNGFTATYEDANGNTLGTLQADLTDGCPADPPHQVVQGSKVWSDAVAPGTTFTYGDCHAVASLGKPGLISWIYRWTAPAAGSGPVYAHHGVVDGDADRRSLGDDVVMAKAQLAEGP